MRRFPRYADHFEALEPRQLRSAAHAHAPAAAPAPGDGHDYVMLAADGAGGKDVAPVVRALPASMSATPLPGGFTWFDSTNRYRLAKVIPGVQTIATNGYWWWPGSAQGTPDQSGDIDEASTRAAAKSLAAAGQVVAIDIEQWTTNLGQSGQAALNRTIERFTRLIRIIREAAPTLKLGIYGEMPSQDLWSSSDYPLYEDAAAVPGDAGAWYRASVGNAANRFARWQAGARFLAPLAAQVDYLFPSLYTFYHDADQWTRYARASIETARQFGKPVIPFLWHTYHNSTEDVGKPVDDAYWTRELDTVRAYADGAVIWNDRYEAFNAGDPWVRAIADRVPNESAESRPRATAADIFSVAQPIDAARRDDDATPTTLAASLLAA